MPRVRRREALADENVAEMPAADAALDLDPLPVWIAQPLHRPRDLLIERRPPAARVELRRRDVERRVAPPAHVRAFLEEVVVLPAEGSFRSLVDDDPLFRRCELVHARLLMRISPRGGSWP